MQPTNWQICQQGLVVSIKCTSIALCLLACCSVHSFTSITTNIELTSLPAHYFNLFYNALSSLHHYPMKASVLAGMAQASFYCNCSLQTHVMVWGNPTHWRADIRDETWPAAHPPTGPGIPSITFISTCPMMLLIALKIGVDWPPMSYLWNYIRKLKPSSQHASFTPRVHKTRWNVDSWIW